MRNLQILLAFLTLVALSTSRGNDDPFKRDLLLPRATTANSQPTAGEGSALVGDSTPESTAEPTDSASATKDSDSSKTTDDAKSSGSDSKSDDNTKKTTGTGKTTSSKKSSKTTSIPSTAQVGSVEMVTPAATDGYTIFKIGDPVTFQWNYTDLVITPAAINVAAYCTSGASTFTITGNASADITSVVWDTGEYQSTATVKLPVATYSLYIWDASKARTEVASAGYLSPALALTFGMYTPQSYVPLSEFHCETCNPNAAASLRQNFVVIFGTCILAALSGIWFMAGIM